MEASTPRRSAKTSPLQRNHHYCGHSFSEYAVDWFDFEVKRQSTPPSNTKPPKSKTPPPEPTRVQPSRAKKRPVLYEPTPLRAAKKKRVLDEDARAAFAERWQFRHRISTLVDDNVAALEMEGKMDKESGPREPHQCALADYPMACTDGLYCLHGFRDTSAGAEVAPEAEMLPSPTLGRWSGQVLGMEDIRDRVVEEAGLKFAVDICDGSVKIVML